MPITKMSAKTTWFDMAMCQLLQNQLPNQNERYPPKKKNK